jgi:tetratricopeptide (TPR) repeat protein
MNAKDPPDPYGLGADWRRQFDGLLGLRIDWSKQIDMSGEHPFFYAMRAYSVGFEASEGFDDLSRAIRLVPISRGLRHLRHQWLLARGQREEADAEWKRVQMLAPTDLSYSYHRAVVLRRMKDMRGAADLFRYVAEQYRSMRDLPRKFTIYRDAARAYAQAGDASNAVKMLREQNAIYQSSQKDFGRDRDFDAIRATEEFQSFLQTLPEE